MTKRRRWNAWPGKVAHELNGVSGVAGVGGTVASIATWGLFNGVTAFVLSGAGGLIAIGAIGYACWKAIPPIVKRPDELLGKTIALGDLRDITPQILKVAIIGPSMAGKTTLKSRLSFTSTPHDRTQTVTAYITALQTAPPVYVAILDGGGEQFAQQFRIAEPADILCVVIDHNSSDSSTTIDEQRLGEHAEFFRQIRGHLTESNAKDKRHVEILLNKRDLWQQLSDEGKRPFLDFYADEERRWKEGGFGKAVFSRPHSNEISDDVAQFVVTLKDTTKD